MNTLEHAARSLSMEHGWLTEEGATALLVHAWMRFKDQAKYGGNLVESLMRIEYGILLRCSEEELRNRLAMAQDWVLV